jgi:carboxypeptidase family protein
MRRNAALVAVFAGVLIGLVSLHAQAPTGAIGGVVSDPTGSVIPGTRILVTNKQTGAQRTLVTTNEGDYSVPALLAGVYEVTAEAAGFQRLVREALVETGSTTTVNLAMQLGPTAETATVEGASPQIRYDSQEVGGVVTRPQIEGLPLNGRSFLELAKLEPGAQQPTRGSNNRTFVPVLGQTGGNSGRGTRVTIDGGSIMAIGTGGSSMGFSQEVVQEFQIATVNFDLTTGLTDGASVNVVTRSGTNDLHGTAFYFFRDHHLAAYPALKRDPANSHPFFQRRQFGFAFGGPVRRDRLFFFGNLERNEQRGVVATTVLGQDFAHFSRITASPFFGDQLSVRVDGRFSNAHTAFVRYSHDGSRAFGPTTLASNPKFAYPSNWTRQQAWVDQTMLGVTSVLRSTLVNDLRFSYFFISSRETSPTEQNCPGCLGIGAPEITIAQASLEIGSGWVSYNLGRRFHLNDALAWQRGTHRVRLGMDWEHNRGGLVTPVNNPLITLFSPQEARQANIPVPAAFNTVDDILRLPLQTVTVAVGDPRVPQEGGGKVRRWNTLRLYFQDTWQLHPRLTLNYGLGWNIDRNLNYDLSKPALLAPILGPDGLGPTRKQWKNFSPLLGLAWMPSGNGKTVIRGGAGIFYDFLFPPFLDDERALLGPRGLGQQLIPGSSIACPVSPVCPPGAQLNFKSATLFTGANLMAILPAVRADLLQKLANADRSVQAIQVTKTGTLNPAHVPSSSAFHVNLGIEREIARDFVVSADFAYRHFVHLGFGVGGGAIDLNHFDSARGPVIPKCIGAQQNDPQPLCSNGPINVGTPAGRVTYRGLLLRADKRLSHGFQLLGSYAYSSNTGTNGQGPGTGFNLDNWFENRGSVATDITHIVNLAGVAQLPSRFELGLNFSYSSAPPFSAYVGGIDFNGDGTKDDLLPGSTVNAFNRGMGRADLERLVAQFNQTYAGTKDAQGNSIPRLTLPARYSFGRNFQSLDLRLSRSFLFGERWRLSLIGEVFNLYNAANLSGYSGNLTSPAFGQPTSRFTQVFGSGGPRAFQLAARVSF